MSPAEAEELAKKAVGDYLTACGVTERAQVGDYLMKLCSVAGVVMARAAGRLTLAVQTTDSRSENDEHDDDD